MDDILSFLPYYEELTLVSRAGIALISTFVAGISMFVLSLIAQIKISFDRCFCFSLFTSSILWLAAFSDVIKFESIILLVVFFTAFLVIKFTNKLSFRDSFYLWIAYTLPQIILFAILYCNINS